MHSLNDYRLSIREAVDSQQLTQMLLRAIPLAYREMGLPQFSEVVPNLQVEVNLERRLSSWRCHANIGGPRMLEVLSFIDPLIFSEMFGGTANASMLRTQPYNNGFSANKKEFTLEPVFSNTIDSLFEKLSVQTSVSSYWREFFTALPSLLQRQLGIEHPTVRQEEHIHQKINMFKEAYLDLLMNTITVRGALDNGNPSVDLTWYTTQNYGPSIDSKFVDILQACPFFQLRSEGVRGYKINDMHFGNSLAGIKQRALVQAQVYCELHGTRVAPAYALSKLLLQDAQDLEIPDMDFSVVDSGPMLK